MRLKTSLPSFPRRRESSVPSHPRNGLGIALALSGTKTGAAVLAALILTILILPSPRVTADPLGRLFTTPQQRRQLDELRRAREETPETGPTLPREQVQTPEAPRDPLTVRGVVTRSTGPAAAWINDSNTLEGDLAAEYLRVNPGDIEAGTVRLPATGTKHWFGPDEKVIVPVKVGQTLEPSTGRVIDLTDLKEPAVAPD